ncbi:MAG: MFS transporter [Chloroflexota bacterium]|nr:MFS transporter [Chloroflexota bacterium]
MLGCTEIVSWGVLYYSFSVFVAPMSAELGGSRAAIAGALSVMLVVSGIAGVVVGRWLDDHGPRLLMASGSIAAALLTVAWSRVGDLPSYYAVWILIGLAFAATNYSPAFATITVWFRRLRARALTAMTLIAGFSSTLFVPLAAWLVATHGWRDALLYLAALLALTTIPLHALVLRRRPSDLGLGIDGDAFAPPAGAPPPAPEVSSSLREALRHPSFPWIAGAFAMYALGVGVGIHLVAFLHDEGYSLAFAAAATGGLGIAQVLGRLVFAPLEERLPQRTLALLIYAACPVALAVLLLVPSPAGVVVFVALFGAGRGSETLLRSTLVARYYGARRFASIYGVLTLFMTGTQALAPVALGAAYDAARTYVPGLWVLVALLCGSSLCIYVAERRRQRTEDGGTVTVTEMTT